MKPTRAKTPGRVAKTNSKENLVRDPVQVFCRIKKSQEIETNPCMHVLSSSCVRISPPDQYKGTNYKPINYTFKEVFDQDVEQHEVFQKVGLPLVENLISGKNGLLFTYGVTGSGKTYTMTGEPQNGGVMPRCLDVIFRSIERVQARRYVFKPDKMNMFETQSDAEAALQRQQNLYKMNVKSAKKNNSNPDLATGDTEMFKVSGVNEDCLYSVFVTYIEIYNNCVYDLLEEGTLGRNPQTKIVREDGLKNMYVHGVTEVEVKSRDEALEAFYKGLKRKRMAHTCLNAESSRSHSVFTIRLVQAPVDSMGESVVQDKKLITVRQLSLVDLAGSERTSRTNNTGQRLREAGNINNSLMTLRACLEALRENQLSGVNSRIVPYRDAKITHLFKNFFDGEGVVRMIVCINPSCDDYDETLHVMRFAEMAMEVEVSRPRPLMDMNVGMTPGRRKANLMFKQARERIFADGKDEANQLDVDLALVYSLGGDFPSLELGTDQSENYIKQLMTHLELRIQRRQALQRDKAVRDERFRTKLDELVKGNMLALSEVAGVKAQLQQERQRGRALETKLMAAEDTAAELHKRLEEIERDRDALQQELNDKEMMLNQKDIEKENQKRRFSQKIATHKEKLETEAKIKIWKENNKVQQMVQAQEQKIQLVKKILSDPSTTDGSETRSSVQTENYKPPVAPKTPAVQNSRRGIAVANLRHRRSLSADPPNAGERWVQHTQRYVAPMGTGFQPTLPRRKSTTKLNVKDITSQKNSNYCLLTQDLDTDGEVETKLYKGNIIPTCGGGAQVVLSDVEMLKLMEPTAVGKKRDVCDTPSKKFGNEWKKPRV